MVKNPLLYTHIHWPGFSSWHQTSKYMEWEVRACDHGDPHPPPPGDSVVFYTNSELEHAANHRALRKVAFLLESKFIAWWTYDYAEAHLDYFDTVLTYDEGLIARHPGKCQFFPHGGCSIPPKDRKIWQKDKLVSFWATNRKTAPGHYARHEFYELYTNRQENWLNPYIRDLQIDCYGQLPHNYAKTMLDCLGDYMFQIVMENNISETYFTEKLIDCLVTGTIPIYRGSRGASRFFDANGILYFTTTEELVDILSGLSTRDYIDRLEAVRANYRIAQNFVLAEDWIYKNTDLFGTGVANV
jgi:hypothetical protein